MSQPYRPPGDPHHLPPHPYGEVPQRRLGLGAGAALGVLIGFIGPIGLALLTWAAERALPDGAGSLVGPTIVLILIIPVLLLIAGCVLMVSDDLRGVGVAALMASGVWLVCSAGVCTVAFFGALASYEQAML